MIEVLADVGIQKAHSSVQFRRRWAGVPVPLGFDFCEHPEDRGPEGSVNSIVLFRPCTPAAGAGEPSAPGCANGFPVPEAIRRSRRRSAGQAVKVRQGKRPVDAAFGLSPS